jgi:hypothetical protein
MKFWITGEDMGTPYRGFVEDTCAGKSEDARRAAHPKATRRLLVRMKMRPLAKAGVA